MIRTVQFQRAALLELVRGPWTELRIAAPRIGADAVQLILPYLQRTDCRIRVITCLTPQLVAEGLVDLSALLLLRSLPGCEIRSQAELKSCLYATQPGPALVSSAPLTLAELDAPTGYGVLLEDSNPVITDFEQSWAAAEPFGEGDWANLVMESSRRVEARTVGEELSRVGAFVRIAMRGTRRTRRLDPRDFGVPEGEWGRVVRPVEVALFKLDEVVKAKDDLEAVLAEKGLEWSGYYLVPRHFLERDWDRLFKAREKQLRDRLLSAEGKTALKTQLNQARRELEAFFGEIYPRADSAGMTAEAWIDQQTNRVLTETITQSVLEESGIEYRVLTILPEDSRSMEELHRLLQDERLQSVQLTFGF